MKINSNNWFLSIDLNGGRIQELTYKGVKVFGTYKRIDGKEGNTHICAPSFDKEGQDKYNLPFHGYARTLPWNGKRLTDNILEIKTITTPSQTYPAKLDLTQTFMLDEEFKHTIEIKNSEGIEVPVNIGVHYYWDTPKGWERTIINTQPVASLIKTNGYSDLTTQSTIAFPHAKYQMISEGFHSVMLWTSFKTDGTEKTYSNDFCCIEPIIGWPRYFGSASSILRSGESVIASIRIKKVV